jgi:hypothetical protein
MEMVEITYLLAGHNINKCFLSGGIISENCNRERKIPDKSDLLNIYVKVDVMNSAYSCNIFKIRKRIIRLIINAGNRDSCRSQLFRNLKILPLKSLYIFSFHYLLLKMEIYMN